MNIVLLNVNITLKIAFLCLVILRNFAISELTPNNIKITENAIAKYRKEEKSISMVHLSAILTTARQGAATLTTKLANVLLDPDGSHFFFVNIKPIDIIMNIIITLSIPFIISSSLLVIFLDAHDTFL